MTMPASCFCVIFLVYVRKCLPRSCCVIFGLSQRS